MEKTLEATEKEKSSKVREFVRKEDLEEVPRNPGTWELAEEESAQLAEKKLSGK